MTVQLCERTWEERWEEDRAFCSHETHGRKALPPVSYPACHLAIPATTPLRFAHASTDMAYYTAWRTNFERPPPQWPVERLGHKLARFIRSKRRRGRTKGRERVCMLCNTRIEEGEGRGASRRARRGGFARRRRVDARVASRSAAAKGG